MLRDNEAYEEMRAELMGMTVKELRQVARDERITLGYAASRKDSMVSEIVCQRRHRDIEGVD